MPALVTVDQAAAFLGGLTVDDTFTALVDQVEAAFNAQCGRSGRPFRDAQSARTEKQDGTGSCVLYLDYPIAILTSVKLGYDVSNPDATLDVADRLKLIWEAGSRRIVRVDGGSFGCRGRPSYVTVLYDAEADLPADAPLAILRGISTVFGQMGSEDVKAEAIGGYRPEYIAALEGDPIWCAAVDANRVYVP